jgi:hypothetical protein
VRSIGERGCLARMAGRDAAEIYSWDKRLTSRIPGVTRLEP